MMSKNTLFLVVAVLIGPAACARTASPPPEAAVSTGATLPSWNDGPSRTALTSFVSRVTTPGNPDFVAAPERIAVFDNDGTLWAEQPTYFQLAFALDRVKALAADHPEWQTREPFKSSTGQCPLDAAPSFSFGNHRFTVHRVHPDPLRAAG
jgi:hypothetical protein